MSSILRAMLITCVAFGVAVLAGCGSSGTSAAHLGCDQFCQQAGTPQGDGPPATDIRIDTRGTILPLSDGTIPITVTCRASRACSSGSLLIMGPFNDAVHSQSVECAPTDACMGRSNLVVAAHSTRTIAVPLTAAGRQLLDTHRRVGVSVGVWCCGSQSQREFEQTTWPIMLALSQSAPSGAVIVGVNPPGLGESRTVVAASGNTVWVACADQARRIDAMTGKPIGRAVPIGPFPDSIAAAGGNIWVASSAGNSNGTLTRIDAATGSPIGRPISLGRTIVAGLATGQGSLWVLTDNDYVVRLDAVTGQVVARPIALDSQFVPNAIVDGDGSVWVAVAGTLQRINPSSNTVIGSPAEIGNGSLALAVGQHAIWVASGNGVQRVDPTSGARVGLPVKVGLGPDALVIDRGSVWVANEWSNTVTRLDANSGSVVGSAINAGLDPLSIASTDGSLWVVDGGNDLLRQIVEH